MQDTRRHVRIDGLNRYRGCLLGGAAGDALGYPVEFDSRNEIWAHYGPISVITLKSFLISPLLAIQFD